MHIYRTCALLFFSLQLISATIIPIKYASPGTNSVSDPRISSLPNLFARAKTCPCRNRKCKGNKIKDPKNCKKCIRCPPKQRPNVAHTVCKDREKEYQRKKKEERRKLREKRYQNTKGKKRVEFKELNEKAKTRKKLRIGKCIPYVATALGLGVGAPFLTEFFSEDFLKSDDLLEFWGIEDPGMPNAPDIGPDDLVDNEEFIDSYVNLANEEEDKKKRRSLPNAEINVEKRNLLGDLIRGIVRAFTEVGKAIGRVVRKPKGPKKLDQDSVKIAKGKGTKSVQEQKNAVNTLKQNKNFKRCLEGKKGEK